MTPVAIILMACVAVARRLFRPLGFLVGFRIPELPGFSACCITRRCAPALGGAFGTVRAISERHMPDIPSGRVSFKEEKKMLSRIASCTMVAAAVALFTFGAV